MKRASYRHAIEWIALNDEPGELAIANVAYQVSSMLVADLFGVDPERVGFEVVRYRVRLDEGRKP